MRWLACATGVGLFMTAALGVVVAQSTTPTSPDCAPTSAAAPPPAKSPSLPYGSGVSPTPYTSPSLPYGPRPTPYTPSAGTPSTAGTPGATTTPGTPGANGTTAPTDPGTGSDSRSEGGSDALASAAPQMIGDLIGTAAVGVKASTGSRQTYIRALAGSGVKIADNESPRPQDRVFATFNYFNGVESFGAGTYGLYRGLIGFEKTFLDGNASFGMRLPFLQADGPGAIGGDGFGTLSAIFKYAFYLDTATGDVASAGLAVSAPTGIKFRLADGSDFTSTLIQPWGGFIYSFDDVYTQGFTSLIIPTQRRDVTLYTADLGVGYRLYRASDDGWLRAIIPTFETHFNVPFSSAGPASLTYFPDLLMSWTGGIHFGVGDNAWFTVGAGVPLTGPRLYDAEFITQLNVRY